MSAIVQVHYRPLPAQAIWTLRDAQTGRLLARKRNTLTSAGLTNLASSWAGQATPPLYLIISNFYATPTTALAAGLTSIILSQAVHQAGDTQLVLDIGGANQETVSFSAASSGGGACTYTLSAATTKTHTTSSWCDRAVLQADTLPAVKQEVQYDSVAAPNARMKATPPGYSSGTGSYTMQFYLTGNQALTQWISLGLSDTGVVGAGTLHNHLVFGYNHQQGNDVEIDVTLTLTNA